MGRRIRGRMARRWRSCRCRSIRAGLRTAKTRRQPSLRLPARHGGQARDDGSTIVGRFSVQHYFLIFPRVELFESDIANGVFAPVSVVEVPPFVFVYGEAFGLHGPAKEITMPALQRSAAGIVGKRSWRHFVIKAGHLD